MAARVLLLLALFSLCGATTFYRKHLAGPPSEFQSNKLPSPQDAALEERSAIYEIKFKPSSSSPRSSVYSIPLLIDSDTLFSFSIFSPLQDKFKVILKNPSGELVDLSTHIQTGDLSSFPIGLGSIPGINYLFEAPFPKGNWVLTIQTSELVKARLDNEADGLLILFNESPIRAHTYLTTYQLKKGNHIGLATRLIEEPEGTLQPKALRDTIVSAVLQVRDPNGDNEDIPMHDDGLHGDEESNDGIWGAFIDATQEGMYRAEAFIVGTSTSGLNFARTTQHLIPILNPHVKLANEAFFHAKDNKHVDVVIGVSKLVSNDDTTYRAYAELWGKDKSNNDIAVCWLAGLVNVENVMGQDSVSLELDLQWAKKAGAHGPFSLRNVVLQDIDVYVPIDESAQISVLDFEGVAPSFSEPVDLEITKEMKQGVFPTELLKRWAATNTTAAAPSLLLVHGYCSDVNPWLKYGSDFTGATFFLEKLASLTHDKFAQLVVQYVQNNGMTRWSGIGHSQGGMVLTHVLNYYFSGLDQSSGGRRIQSVGAPYKGNSGAGSAANLIKIFGYGCGENFDLTTDGSNLWNPGITNDVRDEVYYYTTTYKQGQLFGDYCNLAVNLLLKWPNDGTCEEALSDLTGGHDVGNKQQWCHTADMKYTAQYYDSDRNKEMNSQAAR